MRYKGKLLYRVEKEFSFLKNDYSIGDTFIFIDGIPKHKVFVKAGWIKPFPDDEYRYFASRNITFDGKKYKFGEEVFNLTFLNAKKFVLCGLLFQETIHDLGRFVNKNKFNNISKHDNKIPANKKSEKNKQKITYAQLAKQFKNLKPKDLIKVAVDNFKSTATSHLNNVEPEILNKLVEYLINNKYEKAE